jgi:hypothetical protein
MPSCLLFDAKYSRELFLNADFGIGNVQERNVVHQNRLCFSLLLSFAEAKESRGSEPFPVIIL